MKRLALKKIVPGVFENAERLPRFSQSDADFCLEQVEVSPTKRARICMHMDTNDRQQEMFIAFDGATYVRPSYHVNKDESFHMMDGYGKYVFFDEEGKPTFDIRLGPYESDLPFYCRIPGNLSHSLVVYSDYAMAHEVTRGPFEKAATVFPSWSPDLKSAQDQHAYRQHHAQRPADPVRACVYERQTDEVFRTKPGVVSVSRADLEYMRSEANRTVNKRICLCVHQSDKDQLHEMFGVYTHKTFFGDKLHFGKDKSLHILEGEADLIIFDEVGNIRDLVQLGDRTKDKNIFVRVPQGVTYSLIVRSEYLIVHEATSGPFNREETLWADWSPLDSELPALKVHQQHLEMRLARFLAGSSRK
jgi:cupin fold WbuC family metalloprotein